MKIPSIPVILYFFADSVPTPEERIEVSQIRGKVFHRTAALVGPDDKMETCDGVAGTIPEIYKKKPSAAAAIKAYDAAISALSKKTGDSEAPKVSGEAAKEWKGSAK